jgi:hypothetical protein
MLLRFCVKNAEKMLAVRTQVISSFDFARQKYLSKKYSFKYKTRRDDTLVLWRTRGQTVFGPFSSFSGRVFFGKSRTAIHPAATQKKSQYSLHEHLSLLGPII